MMSQHDEPADARPCACSIGNVFMEYSPGVYDKAGRWADYPDWPHMLT